MKVSKIIFFVFSCTLLNAISLQLKAQKNPDIKKNINLGDQLFAAKKYKEAKEKYNIALKIDEGCKECVVKIEKCNIAQRKTMDARRADIALTPVNINGKMGYRNQANSMVIPAQYIFAFPFINGLAEVLVGNHEYFINQTGQIIIDAGNYGDCTPFSEGLASVSKGGNYGYINYEGELVIPASYKSAWYFSEGLAAVEINDKWGYINKSGKLVIPAVYDFAYPFSEGLAGVEINKKLGYINKSGRIVISAGYDEITFYFAFGKYIEGGGNWFYKNDKGTLISPYIYRNIGLFHNGFAKVQKNGQPIYLDKKGVETL